MTMQHSYLITSATKIVLLKNEDYQPIKNNLDMILKWLTSAYITYI